MWSKAACLQHQAYNDCVVACKPLRIGPVFIQHVGAEYTQVCLTALFIQTRDKFSAQLPIVQKALTAEPRNRCLNTVLQSEYTQAGVSCGTTRQNKHLLPPAQRHYKPSVKGAGVNM